MFDQLLPHFPIIAVFLAATLLVLALTTFGKFRRNTPSYPYDRAPHLLSPAELAFYRVLCTGAAADNTVLAAVRIADVLAVRRGLERAKWQSAFNKISAKHFDFLLCDSDTMQPLIAIELDDRSHQARKRQRRDAFIEGACQAAGLPLLRFPARSHYDAPTIRQRIVDAKHAGTADFVSANASQA